MMSNFKPRLGTKFQVQTAPVNDGQFIVATDSRELFYDNGTLRIPLADIVFLNTEEERVSILAPLPKFYFVIATGKLYVWDGTIWTIINDDPFDENSLPPAGSLPTLLFIKHGKANNFTFIDNGEDLPAVGDLAVVSAHGTASLYQAVRPLI